MFVIISKRCVICLISSLLVFFSKLQATLSLHILCNIRSNVCSQKVPGISLDGRAIRADEELLEVPGNVCPLDRAPDQELGVCHQALRVIAGGGQRLLQELEHRMLIFAIGLNLVKQCSFELKPISRPDMLQSIDNFLSSRIFLVAKLVCWKSQDSQFPRKLFAKFIHLRKVSGGCASQGGGVLHQHHLALVPVHLDHLARQGAGRQCVEPGHL